MVRNLLLYFDFFTSENPCDSSTSLRANFWLVTPKKFLKHGFSFLSPKSSIFFRILIKVTLWLINIENSTLDLEQLSLAQVENFSKS